MSKYPIVRAPKRPAKGRRILPPVSKAPGGVQPGIDLNDSAALQEIEDLDYVERVILPKRDTT